MIIGGKVWGDPLDSVELFNYQTGQSCQIEKMPTGVMKAIGGILDGFPGVNFINILRATLCRKVFLLLFISYCLALYGSVPHNFPVLQLAFVFSDKLLLAKKTFS